MNKRLLVSVTSFLAACFVAVMPLGGNGCSRDSDPVRVDFSKPLPVARSTPHAGEACTLRGAVAAMISPRETFVHYRQLLDYLAKKFGKDLEFVQRKTYEEINELLGKGEIDLAFICSGPYASTKASDRAPAGWKAPASLWTRAAAPNPFVRPMG